MKPALRASMLVAALAVCGGITQAQADTQIDQFTVSANINVSCAIIANDMNFGNYDPGTAVDGTAISSIDVNCTNGIPYAVTVSTGQGTFTGSCTALDRRMFNGTFSVYLDYALFTDGAYSSPLGCDVSNDIDGIGSGVQQSLAVYGRIPNAQSFQPGLYQDTLTATITF